MAEPTNGRSSRQERPDQPAAGPPAYAALDLGTNNCRLLVARPSRRGFKVIDAFSRIIRLGEGVTTSGRLSDAAMQRTVDALQSVRGQDRAPSGAAVTADRHGGLPDRAEWRGFLATGDARLGLGIEIVDRETEARLAVAGCASLIEPNADLVLVFDIGGGSSELIWLDLAAAARTSAARWRIVSTCKTHRRVDLAAGRRRDARRTIRRPLRRPGHFREHGRSVTSLLDPFEAGARHSPASGRARSAHARNLWHGHDARRCASRTAALRSQPCRRHAGSKRPTLAVSSKPCCSQTRTRTHCPAVHRP